MAIQPVYCLQFENTPSTDELQPGSSDEVIIDQPGGVPTCRPVGRSREESVPTGFFSSKRVGQEKVRDESYYKEVISSISHEWLLRQPCAAFRNLISPATRTLYYAYALRSGTTLTSALSCKVVSGKDHSHVECFEILISPTTRLYDLGLVHP